MKRYTAESRDMDVDIVDGTKFVTSGEYYFDCINGSIVSRNPKVFPVENVQRIGKVDIVLGSNKQYEAILKKELSVPDFFYGLKYHYTVLSADADPEISCDVYYKIIKHDGKTLRIEIDDFRGSRYTATIKDLEPDFPMPTYEERRERARNSCTQAQ